MSQWLCGRQQSVVDQGEIHPETDRERAAQVHQ